MCMRVCSSDTQYPKRLEGGLGFVPCLKPRPSMEKCGSGVGGGGGGGCFPSLRGLGEKVRQFISRLHLKKRYRSARAYQFHFLCQNQSTVARRVETTVSKCSLTSCT